MKHVRIVLIALASLLGAFAQESDEAGLVPLSEALQDRYAKTPPKDFLVDPQGLLRGGEARERREFLRYHSSDSLIDLYVVLFNGDQKLFNPGDLSGHLFGQRSKAKPAVLIHYFMGRPERAQLHLSPELTEIVPPAEQGRALENSIKRAKTGVSSMDELEKFMVQTSIGIYRMERLLTEGTASPAPLVIANMGEADDEAKEKAAFLETLSAYWSAHGFKLVGALILLAAFWFLRRWHRRRASYLFPESVAMERLGGAHAAGVGAVISFGKSSPPPAAQLEKLKMH